MKGYKEAATFKCVSDEQIESVENHIKNQLIPYFNRIESRESSEKIDRLDFFGSYYYDTPNEFEMNDAERLLIKQMAEHVRTIVDPTGQPNAGIGYFRFDENDKKLRKTIHHGTKYINSLHGRFFTLTNEPIFACSNKPSETSDPNVDLCQLKQQLFADVSRWLTSNTTFENLSPFDESMVLVEIGNDNKINGQIACTFCKAKNNINKRLKVAIKNSENIYWILSNFVTHVNKCHADCLKDKHTERNNDCVDIVHASSHKTIENTKSKTSDKKNVKGTKRNCSAAVRVKKEKVEHIEIDENSVENESTDSIIELSIEPLADFQREKFDVNEVENIIYKQISDQLVYISEASQSKSKRDEMAFDIDGESVTLVCTKIARDGHCLFRSLSHQLWKKEQNQSTIELRAAVVSYIKEHFSSFLWQLRGAVLNLYGNVPNIHEQCKRFLMEELSTKGWGGSETIKAVTNMHSVNVLVFNENGPSHFPFGFNTSYPRTILLAYRLQVPESDDECDESNKNELWESIDESNTDDLDDIIHDHYDSVSHIEQNIVFQTAKSTASIEAKKLNYLEISHVSVESE